VTPRRSILALALAALPAAGFAQQDASDLAKQLSNPVSSLISVPFQYNYNEGYGPNDDGHQSLLNIQPVIPISISENWNLISRTIIPVIHQDDVIPGQSQSGFGDTTQSFFFSPKLPTSGGLIWGVGPAFLLPTGTDGLGANQWAAGLTGVALVQKGPWTYGALANHLWDVGDGDTEISNSFFQPFLSYTTADAWSFTVNSETSYNWETNWASVPLNFMVAKVTRIGKQPISIQGGVRYWVDAPDNGPEGWGARLNVTFLFPK
jgi:hypothetical protein